LSFIVNSPFSSFWVRWTGPISLKRGGLAARQKDIGAAGFR
jgi:hypothetical protein